MSKYKSSYFMLFSAISDTLETLESLAEKENDEKIKEIFLKECSRLKKAQLAAEDKIISDEAQ